MSGPGKKGGPRPTSTGSRPASVSWLILLRAASCRVPATPRHLEPYVHSFGYLTRPLRRLRADVARHRLVYLAQCWNGSTEEFHVDGAGNLKAAGAVQAGVVSTASLPRSCTVGQQLYVSDGRTANETAGEGSGVPVICSVVSRGGATAWFSTFSGAGVQS